MILRIYILLFLCAIISAQDFEVDGDLKVIGDLQASKIDSLESSIDSLRIQIQQLNSLLNNSYLKFIDNVSVELDDVNDEYEYFIEPNTLNEFLMIDLKYYSERDLGGGSSQCYVWFRIDGNGIPGGSVRIINMGNSDDFGIYSIYRFYYELTEDNINNGFNVSVKITQMEQEFTIDQLLYFGK